LKRYPEFKDTPIILSGESYAGHYLPAISAYLIKKNDPEVHLAGVAMGNPWTNPQLQFEAGADFLLKN